MIHLPTSQLARNRRSQAIYDAIDYRFPISGRLTILRWNLATAAGVTSISVERLIIGPHKIGRFSFSQNVAQIGASSCNLFLSNATTATLASTFNDIPLFGTFGDTTTLFPSNFPQHVVLDRIFNRARSFYKAVVVNSTGGPLSFQLTLELTPLCSNP
jgi:hypothetical protein